MPDLMTLLAFAEQTEAASSGIVGMAIALVALTAMEIVLGIDNIVFLSIVSTKLPPEQQKKARLIGLTLALGMRILLLMFIKKLVGLTEPILVLDQWLPSFADGWLTGEGNQEINNVSWRDVILFTGGLFLIFKSVKEIDHHIVGPGADANRPLKKVSFQSAVAQIIALDLVFSLDSVITAVGMVDNIGVMITAVMIAIVVMMVFAGTVADFVDQNPTVKMLALSFLLLIGVVLVADGLGTHISKGYVYFAMGFALLVEFLNLKARKKAAQAEPS
jgi:predicted tellurium resistance membrane protein TerC